MIYKKNYLQKFQLYIKTSKFISISVTLVNSLTYLIYIHTHFYTLSHIQVQTLPATTNACFNYITTPIINYLLVRYQILNKQHIVFKQNTRNYNENIIPQCYKLIITILKNLQIYIHKRVMSKILTQYYQNPAQVLCGIFRLQTCKSENSPKKNLEQNSNVIFSEDKPALYYFLIHQFKPTTTNIFQKHNRQ
eukprot:TRINITY_DN8647_c0_g1_i11.p1 TRINITY_DN8647_c0_g1~~TRINITY_DN8647_c0_g1_i11.p1  ORF type:complete len:192 (+),score=-28.89 TRINITY_DN8647_c0_g1_i11:160-735(+)